MEKENNLLSTAEVAKMLGISRIAVFKKIKAGDIPARKSGRNYVIREIDLPDVLSKFIPESRKQEIEKVVKKAIGDYGETLKLLGKE